MQERRTEFLAGCLLAIACGGGTKLATGRLPDGGQGSLTWYTTCGPPTLAPDAGHRPSGLPACTTEKEGAACSQADAECDPGNSFNVYLICAASDPKQAPGGCPISRAKYKKDIRFLESGDLVRVRDQLVDLPLATFRYRDAPEGSRLHLGFMIDGHESLACVEPQLDQVDLYGYTSMAVAALKVQARQIDELRAEVDALRTELGHRRRSKAAQRGARPAQGEPEAAVR